MANSKISALTSATTPLAGTEEVPIVQSGATVKATVANITGAGLYAGSFTTLGATGNTTLGDASTDTVRVNGYMGVGGAAASSRSIAITSTALVGTSQFGIVNTPTFNSQATSAAYSYFARVQTEAASFTLPFATAYIASTPTKGAGSTITNLHGVYIDDQTQGTNNYGITSLVSSGTNKFNIYASGTAQNYFSGNVLIFGAGGMGYATGSGGTVTQATSRTTGVTLNKTNGAITLFTDVGSITATTFTVTNSTVAATDVVNVCQKSGTNLYNTLVTAVAAGSFNITFYTTGGIASDAPVFNFAVTKAVTA
jgi:hypothetical protein